MPGFVETLPATSQKQENCVVTLFDGRACLARKKQATPARWAKAHPTPDKRHKHWLLVLETLQATSLRFSFFVAPSCGEKPPSGGFAGSLPPLPAFSHLSPQVRGERFFVPSGHAGGSWKKRGGLLPPRSYITAVLPPAAPTLARCHPVTWCAAGRRSIVPPASSG